MDATAAPNPTRSTRAATLATDPKRIYGLVAIALGAGIMLGFYLRRDVPALPSTDTPFIPGHVGGPVPPAQVPCTDCAEKRIRNAQMVETAATQAVVRNVVDPPAPVIDATPAETTFDHTTPAPPGFSGMATPVDDTAPVGVPVDRVG